LSYLKKADAVMAPRHQVAGDGGLTGDIDSRCKLTWHSGLMHEAGERCELRHLCAQVLSFERLVLCTSIATDARQALEEDTEDIHAWATELLARIAESRVRAASKGRKGR
jgi:hypothetical protein